MKRDIGQLIRNEHEKLRDKNPAIADVCRAVFAKHKVVVGIPEVSAALMAGGPGSGPHGGTGRAEAVAMHERSKGGGSVDKEGVPERPASMAQSQRAWNLSKSATAGNSVRGHQDAMQEHYDAGAAAHAEGNKAAVKYHNSMVEYHRGEIRRINNKNG